MKGNSYDTRFLIELFYAQAAETREKIKGVLVASRPNFLSTAALSEIYKLTLEKEGRDVADLRANSLARDFKLIDVNRDVAVQAALIKHRHGIPFADSLIASTSRVFGIPCFTDDPHFKGIEGVSLRWFR